MHIKAPADEKYGYVQIHRGKSPNAVHTVSLTERVANTPVERKKAAKRSIFFPARDGGRVPGTWTDRQHQNVRTKLKLPDDFVLHSINEIAGHSSISISQRY